MKLTQGISQSTILFQEDEHVEEIASALTFLLSQAPGKSVEIILGEDEFPIDHVHDAIEKLDLPIKITITYLSEFLWKRNYQNKAWLLLGKEDVFSVWVAHYEHQTHPTVLEVDLNQIKQNLSFYQSRLEAETSILVMVKANGYGLGATEIALYLEQLGVDYLGVAYTDEGVRLRQAGVKLPIMVMNPDEEAFHKIIQFDLEPEIYNFSGLEKLIETTTLYELEQPWPIHLKLESGMNRLGFQEYDIQDLMGILTKNQNTTRVASVFSHLASSDIPEHDDFTRHQIARFEKMAKELVDGFDYHIPRHILNTTGLVRFPEYQMDRVRLGLGVYGVEKCREEYDGITQVGTLKTRISQIKKIAAGETIGYGRKGKAEQDMSIAVIPIGYADGYTRRYGRGRTSVYIRGTACPTIGDTCMDMSMIDVSHLPDIQAGEEAVIFSPEHPIRDICGIVKLIPYEILTGIPFRVKRIFVL